MGLRVRLSPGFLLLIACIAIVAFPLAGEALQAPDGADARIATSSLPDEPRALYRALNELRPDAARVYDVHDLNLRRDIFSFTFSEGKLAFLPAIGGHVTGAVFTGRGRVLATPRAPGERRSLAQFLGVPILDQTFSRAYIRFTDETAAEIQQQLKSTGNEEAATRFAESWNMVVGALAPTQSLRIMQDLLSNDPLPFFYAMLDGNSTGPFDVLVDRRRDEQILIGQPRTSGGDSFYDVWASFRAQDAPTKPIEPFVPVEYRIDSTIANDLSLEGKTTVRLKTVRAGDRFVLLELSRNLAVEEVRSEDGKPLVFFQNEDLERRDILRRGYDAIFVALASPARDGQEIELQISYHGSVISNAGNGVEFVAERENWYAHAAGSGHFVPFDLTFRWPKRFTLVATGTRFESHDNGDSNTGRWRSEVPFSVVGFNLGEYKMERAAEQPKIQLYANKELEDAIASRLRQSVPVRPLPTIGRSPSEIVADASVETPLPSPATVLKQLGREVLDSIHFYEKLNGEFPFDHLDVAQIPGSFGQGWPGLVYLSTLAFLPAEAQERAGIKEWDQREARDLMPFHEVAHQWWGNVVGAANYRDTWIQEGMANYLALLYAENQKSTSHYLAEWLEHYRTSLLAKAPGSNETINDAGPLSLGSRLRSSKTPDAYRTIIYGKGTWVIHMLHEMLRDPSAKDPDVRFRAVLRAVLTKYRFQALTAEDFQREVEHQMTPAMDLEGTHRLDWFFDEWVRETSIPHYTVKFEVKPRGNEFLVTGRLEQDEVDDLFTASVPLYAARPAVKPERLGVVVTTGPTTRFHFISRVRPTHLLIDPRLTLLCRTN
jgi:Peptidase family M1 domain